jgi:hypothetical protein
MIKKFGNFDLTNEAKYFNDLSERDKKRMKVIANKVISRVSVYQRYIDEYDKYLKEYNLSDDLKEFLKYEKEYLEKIIKSLKKYKREETKIKNKDK